MQKVTKRLETFRLAPLTVDEARYVAAIFAAGTALYVDDLSKALMAVAIAKNVPQQRGDEATTKMRAILPFLGDRR